MTKVGTREPRQLSAQGNRIMTYLLVAPAKAGVQKLQIERIVKVYAGFGYWIPASAGMTGMMRLP